MIIEEHNADRSSIRSSSGSDTSVDLKPESKSAGLFDDIQTVTESMESPEFVPDDELESGLGDEVRPVDFGESHSTATGESKGKNKKDKKGKKVKDKKKKKCPGHGCPKCLQQQAALNTCPRSHGNLLDWVGSLFRFSKTSPTESSRIEDVTEQDSSEEAVTGPNQVALSSSPVTADTRSDYHPASKLFSMWFSDNQIPPTAPKSETFPAGPLISVRTRQS